MEATEDGDEVSRPVESIVKKGRAKSTPASRKKAADTKKEEEKEEADETTASTKKKGGRGSAKKSADEDTEPEPAAKKGRAKSAPSTSSSSKKSKSASQDGGDGDDADGDSGPVASSAVAEAVGLIEQAKRAARPSGSKTLMCWNVNGLRAAIRSGANEYIKQVDPDIIAFCEVKADEATVEREFARLGEDDDTSGTIAAAFAGTKSPALKYHRYWNCSKKQKGYSGVGILSKVKPISVTYGIGPSSKHDEEGRTITAEFDDYYLVCTYVPNSGNGLVRLSYRTTEWDIDLLSYLKELEKKKPVIWTGDLNVAHHDFDIHAPKTNQKSAGFTPEERANFGKVIDEGGFIDVFHKLYPDPNGHRYTYYGHRFDGRSKNRGWRLDYWVVSPSLMESHVLDTWIGSEFTEGHKGRRRSDHLPIFLNIK